MKCYKVQVKATCLVSVVDTFYVDAFDDRGAKQGTLEAAEAAYPEYDFVEVIRNPELCAEGDEE